MATASLSKQHATLTPSSRYAKIPCRRALSVAEYDRMIRAGVIKEDERVELLEGEL